MDACKPRGYNSVSPYLVVRDAQMTIEFLIQAFAAVELRRMSAPGGGMFHAELRIDDTAVLIGEGRADSPPSAANIHMYVQDLICAGIGCSV